MGKLDSGVFDRAFDKVINIEGGYVDHPNDPGKATKFGVTADVARKHGYGGHMRDLPLVTARFIAKKAYWDKLYLDYVAIHSERVAVELLDTGYNMGVGMAAKFFQTALNVLHIGNPILEIDGDLGPQTLQKYYYYLAARGPLGEEILLKALNCMQGARYIELCQNNEKLRAFVNGWFANRVEL